MSSPKIPRKRPGPEGGLRDRNRQANQRRLADAALALFLEHGTAAVTIDQIVERAKMAKGSFYRYAIDKPDVVAQILAPVIVETTAALDRCEGSLRHARRDSLAAIYITLASELSAVVAMYPRHVLYYLQEARARSSPPAIRELAERLTTRTIALTEIARDHGLIRRVDPSVSALTVLGAIEALLFARLRRHKSPAAEVPRITSELVEIVLRGIGV